MFRGNRSTTRVSLVVAVALLGWVVLIVTTSGSNVTDSLLGIDGLDEAREIFLYGVAILVLLIFIWLKPLADAQRSKEEEQRRRRSMVFAALLLLVLLWWQPTIPESLFDWNDPNGSGSSDEPDDGGEGSASGRLPVAQATDILSILGVLVFVVAAWALAGRRGGPDGELVPGADEPTTDGNFVDAIDEAVATLIAGDDPHSAVLKSYAVLERSLAEHGLARTPAETPSEHLRRALASLKIDPSPLIELAGLYELARFSEHRITVSERTRAMQLLQAAQHELGTPESAR